jgi:hypothetical protein
MRHPLCALCVKDSRRVGSWTARRSSPRDTRWAGTAKPRWPTTLPRMALTTSSIARQSRGGGRRRWLSLGWMRVRPYTSHADTVIAMPPQRPGQ